jgi:hypothetical protein
LTRSRVYFESKEASQADLERGVNGEGGGILRKLAIYLVPLLLLALIIGINGCTSAAQCSTLLPA